MRRRIEAWIRAIIRDAVIEAQAERDRKMSRALRIDATGVSWQEAAKR